MTFIKKIFGDANKRVVDKIIPTAIIISNLESSFEKFTGEELKAKTAELRERLKKGETLEHILPEAFALVREAGKRTLKQRHFDVQILGGITLHQGKIAEMRTGEGKTLVATLTAYLNALTGKGVHVVTVNDYLAKRDMVWMGQIYSLLGLSVGCLNHEASYVYDENIEVTKNENSESDEADKKRDTIGGFKVIDQFLRPISRKEAYAADITYGTNNEFGFDYLRDNMVGDVSLMVQRELHYAIIDEVDSILIDEARTPLIISAPDTESTKLYEKFSHIVPKLTEKEDYTVDEKMRAVSITEHGISKVEKILGIENIYEEKGIIYVHHLEEALRAQILFKLDRDYVVKNGEVIIVDEFTGRLMPGRRYSGGLHQAIEAKEGVRVQQESRTLATITFQNYFRMYEKLSGMTGTAATNAEEFHKVYSLDVVTIPTNKPNVRKDLPDKVFKTEHGKFQALVEEIKTQHVLGRPVLVGTVSIDKNEYISKLLEREGVPHQILNAKHHEREAEIIAQAGKFGAVTIATNMAGRGVDIILGGNPPDPTEHEKVSNAGGLCVIGTERHEARRIDNQLRGRAGRQGDPGSTQFFVSLEDDVMRIFGGDKIKSLMERLHIPEDQPIENSLVSKSIESAQGKIEGYNFDTRKHVLEYDDVMNKQRETIYRLRKEVLRSGIDQSNALSNKQRILQILRNEMERLVAYHTVSSDIHEWDTKNIEDAVKAMVGEVGTGQCPVPTDFHDALEKFKKEYGDLESTKARMTHYLQEIALSRYENKGREIGEYIREVEKVILLRSIDMLWMDHLDTMEHLRDSVRLRAYGQRDPLVEYKNEGIELFRKLLEAIESNVANMIFKVSIAKKEENTSSAQMPMEHVHHADHSHEDKNTSWRVPTQSAKHKVGRNDPCPCGSGKKYKKCHGR